MGIIRELLQKAAAYFESKGLDNPRLEAELLLAFLLKTDRVHLFMSLDKPLQDNEVDSYRELVKARASGVPAAYLTGQREFYSLPFAVTPDVLIPRPETEHIIDWVKKNCPNLTSVLDIGTGSGILAVTIAKVVSPQSVLAVDISPAALAVAKQNAATILGVENQIFFRCSDLYQNVSGKFDLIVSNPPYVTTEEYNNLAPGVKDYEPRLALEAGIDGLRCYTPIIMDAVSYLESDGFLVLEISDSVAAGVVKLAQEAGFQEINLLDDYSGHKRVAVLKM